MAGTTGTFRQTGATALTDANFMTVGNSGAGTLQMSGGVIRVRIGQLVVGDASGANGTVEQTGGDVVSTNADYGQYSYIGKSGVGSYHLVDGTLSLSRLTIGNGNGSTGTFTQEGGTNHCYSLVVVGNVSNSVGQVTMSGGVWTCDSALTIGQSVGSFGSLKGYGEVSCGGQFRLNRGFCRADGGGNDHDLDLTGLTLFNSAANANEDTNGWYAINAGRLLWPELTGSIDTNANTITVSGLTSLGWFEAPDITGAIPPPGTRFSIR